MQKIHILGCGWLGTPLAMHLHQSGHCVTTSNRSGIQPTPLQNLRIQHAQTDIQAENCDFSLITQCDYLIVCITGKTLLGFQRLAKALQTSKVQGLLFTSSTSVYASSEEKVTEQHPLLNEHPLVAIEQCLQNITNIPCTIVRLAGLIGGTRHPGRFFVEKPIPDPDFPVNLIHQQDAVEVIAELVARPPSNLTVNACASSHPTKFEFYSNAALQGGFAVPVKGKASGRPKKVVSNEGLLNTLNAPLRYDDLMSINWYESSE